MITGLPDTRILQFFILILICSCSGNVMQSTVFTDGFQELEPGTTPSNNSINQAIYFDIQQGKIGAWKVASTLRQDAFNNAWEIGSEDGKNYLVQTFTNINRNNTPFSLIAHPLVVAGDSLWHDFTIDVEFTPLAKFDKCGVVFKYRSPTDFFFFGIEGNTVILKQIQQSLTPLRPIERILDFRPLVWTPGETLHATVSVRRTKVSTILNDSIRMYEEDLPMQPGKIGLISDMPAKFHSVDVKILKGEQRKVTRRRRQLARRMELQLAGHPEMLRWRKYSTRGFGTDQNIRLGDLTGDGNKEIVFIRPTSPGNQIGSISAMNLEGELLWQYGDPALHPPGKGVELPVQIHDLDGDGAREVIFVSDGRIQILEGRNGKLARRVRVPGTMEVHSMIFGDLLGIGRDNCMLLSDLEHRLMVMNERLELLWERVFESGAQPMVYDMDGDGRGEVLMGYSVVDHQGELLFDVGAFIGDGCNGVSVYDLNQGGRTVPCLIYAAGDWGLMYFDFNGNLLRQNIMGHVRYLSVADFDLELPGLEVATSNHYGSDGLMHIAGSSGEVIRNFLPVTGVNRCVPVNWKGDGEEFMITSADSTVGGMIDQMGQLAVKFPSDGHPVLSYMAQDLTGDSRDEVLVWNHDELWIYTQDDNPRMGRTYAPDRIPLHNYSTNGMNRSIPGW